MCCILTLVTNKSPLRMPAQHMGPQSFWQTTLTADWTNLPVFSMGGLQVVSYIIPLLPFFQALWTFEISVGEKGHLVFPNHPFTVDFLEVAEVYKFAKKCFGTAFFIALVFFWFLIVFPAFSLFPFCDFAFLPRYRVCHLYTSPSPRDS